MLISPAMIVAAGAFVTVPAALLVLVAGMEMLDWSRRRARAVRRHGAGVEASLIED